MTWCVLCNVEFEDDGYCKCGSSYGICHQDGSCQGRLDGECESCEFAYANIATCPICGKKDYLFDTYDPLDPGYQERIGSEKACAKCMGKATDGGYYRSIHHSK